MVSMPMCISSTPEPICEPHYDPAECTGVQVLQLTDPAHWSPHAVYQATRLFVSNLNARMAQRFLALVLLPHIRNDIEDNRRLHHALFQAIKKATYKPDAFFKVPRPCPGQAQQTLLLLSLQEGSSFPGCASCAVSDHQQGLQACFEKC